MIGGQGVHRTAAMMSNVIIRMPRFVRNQGPRRTTMPHDVEQLQERQNMFYPGDAVVVRSRPEILSTLDAHGACGGLPFMPEMEEFIGKSMTVVQRVDKTCSLAGPFKKISDAVILKDSRCDGRFHDGCQMRCSFIWKEEWLSGSLKHEDKKTVEDVELTSRFKTRNGSNTYYCQATELTRASEGDIQWWHLNQYVRDVRSRTFRAGEILFLLWPVLWRKMRRTVSPQPQTAVSDRQRILSSEECLGLKPGDAVFVKTREEIRKTLDAKGSLHGLRFTDDMLQHCGKQFRVAGRVERIISEATGKMVHLKNTVLLEDAVCDRYRGCGRRMYRLWREAWLRRM